MKKQKHKKTALTIVFAIICLMYVMPIIIVGYNAFKTNAAVSTDAFALPNSETFSGWSNFIKGMTFGNFPFLKSALYSTFIWCSTSPSTGPSPSISSTSRAVTARSIWAPPWRSS